MVGDVEGDAFIKFPEVAEDGSEIPTSADDKLAVNILNIVGSQEVGEFIIEFVQICFGLFGVHCDFRRG